MMKTKMNLMLMKAFSVLLLAGCTADELMERPGEVPVSLKTRVLLTGGELTRAGITVQGTQFDSGETFYAYFPSGVRVGNATSASSTTFTTSDSEGATTPATQPYFNAGVESASVHAYYPYVSGKQVTNTTTSFTVEQDQSTDANYKKSDLMYASIDNLTKEGGMVTGTLTFTHKMSKIMVTANLGGGITNIQSIRLVGGSRTINISTPQSCTLGSTLSNANTTSNYVTMWSGTSTSTVDCSALLPPQTLSGNFLQIVTDMGTATYSLDSKLLESGQSYHLIITVNAAAIDMSTEIIDWGETDGISSNLTVDPPAELTVNPISDVTYTGSALTPSLVVKYNTTTLSTSNYDVAWSNNVNVGTAQVIVVGKGATYQGKAGLATFNIVKANPAYTAPTSKSPYYSGNAEQLINAGSSSDGTIYYKLGSGQWTDDATTITGTDVGDYTVYWKIVGDANHNDVAESSVSVEMGKAAATLTCSNAAKSFSGLETTGSTKTTTGVSFTGGSIAITGGSNSTCTASYSNGTITFTRQTNDSFSETFTVSVTPDGNHTAPNSVSINVTGAEYFEYSYVDLGLPSGTLWANANVGASSITDFGGYYQWGGIIDYRNTYSTYNTEGDCSWNNYPFLPSQKPMKWNKYVQSAQTSSWYNYDASTNPPDNKLTLDLEDDAAYINMGPDWRMPTKDEWQELRSGCSWQYYSNFNGLGVNGVKVTSKSDPDVYIFLPCAGMRYGSDQKLDQNSKGYYWSSSLTSGDPWSAHHVLFDNGNGYQMTQQHRDRGFTVRAVRRVSNPSN